MHDFTKSPTVICFGELLWDLLPGGARLGGAPANCAVNVNDLGGTAWLLSAVGDDVLGRQAVEALKMRRMPVEGVQILEGVETGRVDVRVDAAGIATYSIRKDVAWARIALRPEALELASRADGFCYGSLVQQGAESQETLRSLLDASGKNCVRFFDINLRRPHVSARVVRESLSYANILKLNDEELGQIGELLGIDFKEDEILSWLLDTFPLTMILVTQGAAGATVVGRGERIHIDAAPVPRLVDTVGAGDAFSAAFLVGYLRGAGVRAAAEAGVAHASRICGVAGAWLPVPDLC